MKPRVIIKETKQKGKKAYYVIVKARNGKVLMTSEILSSKKNASANIAATYKSLQTFLYP